jgi:hypothetical protein
MQKNRSLLKRVEALEHAHTPPRVFVFWDDLGGQSRLKIAAMRANGEITDYDQVQLVRWIDERDDLQNRG